MKLRQQNSTTQPLLIYMVLSSDGKTPATGKTVTVTASKNGGAFGAASGVVSEIGNGWYSWAGNATDRNTLGPLAYRATAADCDDFPGYAEIVPWNPFDANLGLTNLDAAVSTRLATAGYTAPDNAAIDNIEDIVVVVSSRLGTPAGASLSDDVAAVKADTAAIKIKTDQLTFTVAGHVDATASVDPEEVGGAVWGHTPRTLTQPMAAVVAATQGADLAVLRGDEWVIALEGLGSLVGRQALWFTVKRVVSQADEDSTVQITEDQGLVVLNGSSEDLTAADGEIEVDDEDAGDITITLKAASSAQVEPFLNYFYDVQVLNAAGQIQTKTAARFNVTGDVTRAVEAPDD